MSELHELNESDFNTTVLEEKRLVLIDFWSPTCGPCRMLAPVLETLAKENASVVFLKCNVFENMHLAAQLNISVVPTLIFYKDGSPILRLSGVQKQSKLQEIIDANI
ncbi:MAG: thioredoxin [Thermoguttaceae bacterium]